LYTFACGGWIKNNLFLPTKKRWDVYSKLSVDQPTLLMGHLARCRQTDGGRTPTQQKIGDYFAACMDEKCHRARGLTPIQSDSPTHCRISRSPKRLCCVAGRSAQSRVERQPVLRQWLAQI